MLSIRAVLFLSCAALAMAHPIFFHFATPANREEAEQEQPLRADPYPMNQVASPSYDYGGGGAGAGGSTETQSASNEVDGDTGGSLGGSVLGGDADGADEVGENEAAENAAAENENLDAVQAGGASGAASPGSLDGGPGLAMKGEKSSAGMAAGIAVGSIAMVALAAGVGYFVYRKRRAAAYGSRF